MADAAVKEKPANARRGRARADRRLQSHHRCAEAQRRQDHLCRSRHPDHRLPAHVAGRGPSRALVPPRAERRLCGLDRGLPDQAAGHLPHGVGAGLPQWPDRARARDDELLPDDPDLGLVRARDRRPAAGRLRGDGPARDRQDHVQGGLSRPACRRHRHRHCARDPRRGVGPSGWCLSRPARQAVRSGDRRRKGQEVAGESDRCGAGANPCARRGQACARRAEKREAPADHPRQGRGLCAGRRRDPPVRRKERRAVPADEHGQGPAPRHASAVRGRRALHRAGAVRRRHADRRAAELAPVARQGQGVGRPSRRSSSRSTSSRRKWTRTSRSWRLSWATSARV